MLYCTAKSSESTWSSSINLPCHAEAFPNVRGVLSHRSLRRSAAVGSYVTVRDPALCDDSVSGVMSSTGRWLSEEDGQRSASAAAPLCGWHAVSQEPRFASDEPPAAPDLCRLVALGDRRGRREGGERTRQPTGATHCASVRNEAWGGGGGRRGAKQLGQVISARCR